MPPSTRPTATQPLRERPSRRKVVSLRKQLQREPTEAVGDEVAEEQPGCAAANGPRSPWKGRTSQIAVSVPNVSPPNSARPPLPDREHLEPTALEPAGVGRDGGETCSDELDQDGREEHPVHQLRVAACALVAAAGDAAPTSTAIATPRPKIVSRRGPTGRDVSGGGGMEANTVSLR
jgi:hypothetical protein